MRRFLFGTLAAAGVTLALACGTQIDTHVAPDASSSTSGSSGGGEGGVLADGAPAEGSVTPSKDATTDQFVPVDCDAVFERDLLANYDPKNDAFSVRASATAAGGGVQPFDANGVSGLRLTGTAGDPTYLERALPPTCDRVTAKIRFQFLSNSPFDLLSLSLGSGVTAERRVVISLADDGDFKVARIDPLHANDVPPTTIPNVNAPAKVSQFYVLTAVVTRKGEVWAAVDSFVDDQKAPLIPAEATELDFQSVRIGVESSMGSNAIELDSIRLAPP